MGYVGRVFCRVAPVDNLIVFAIFALVRSVPYQTLPFPEGIAQNRYLPVGYQIWLLYGGWGHNPLLPHSVMLFQPLRSEL